MAALEEGSRFLPRLKTGTYDEYKSLTDRDHFTLYFAYDTQQLFRGDKEYTKSVELIDELPTEGIFGKLYVVKKEDSTSLYTWNKFSNSFTEISEKTPTLQKVLNAGSTIVDSQITFKSTEGNKTVLLNEHGLANIDTEGSTVRTSSLNDEQVLLTENPGSMNAKSVSVTVAEGFKDNEHNVLSSNPDKSRDLTDEEASTMRSRLSVSSDEEVIEKLNEGLKDKVDKGYGFLVKDFEVSINPESEGNGFSIKKTRVDIDGNVENEEKTVKLTAADIGAATVTQVTDVQKEINSVKSGLVRLSLDFSLAFSTSADPANPTMSEVMTFLTKMGITPHSGTSLFNSKMGMSTYRNTFVFYVNPYDTTSSLIMVNEGILGVNTATYDLLGVVKGSGDIRVDTEGQMLIKSESVKPFHLSEDVKQMITGGIAPEDREKLDKLIVSGSGDKILTDSGEYQDISVIAGQL